MSLYQILTIIHVLSAILGMGPGFVMIYFVTKSKTMAELRYAFIIRKRVHVFVMVGGTLLLLTGLMMGMINDVLFQLGWYVVSLTLYLIALSFGPIILSPLSKPIKLLIQQHKGDDIPKEYNKMAKRLFFYERVENVIFIVIIILMVWKPTFLNALIWWLFL